MNALKPAVWNSLPGPDDVTRVELDNGITVLCRANDNSASVVVSGYLVSGSVFDPPEQLGLAHFTAYSLMRGTAGRTFQEIYEALESAGASLGFGASVHNTNFGGRALAEDLPLLLQLLSESLRRPVFPAEQVERLRAQLLASLAVREQDTADMASLALDRILFADHPYGRPEDGFSNTIQAIRREDLVAFHQAHYHPARMVLVVVGGVDPRDAVGLVDRILGDWSGPAEPAEALFPSVRPLAGMVREHIAIPGKSQSDLLIGTLGPRRNSPEYLPLSLGNNVLGQFGMMGRIGDVVREQAGLAYHASTSLNAWISSGSWEVAAGVNPANLQSAIDLILSELRRFVTEPVSAEELQDSQANFVGRLPLSMESNNGVAGALLNMERFQLGLDYYRRYPAMVQAVTPEQVLECARQYLHPERLAVVSAGSDAAGA
ncbi:MAG: insulinase family protein [Chloroflexi bacterium]|nr:pitrilysin family protein [Anaerolineaceae bacterium]NMB87473.1 insulinase family protein [Chloroflexota bacterium]